MGITTQGFGGACLTTFGWGCRLVREALVESEFDLIVDSVTLKDLEVETGRTIDLEVSTETAYLLAVALSFSEDLVIDSQLDDVLEVD